MRVPPRLRPLVLAAALAAAVAAPASAAGAEIRVPALNGTFAEGSGGWTATSSCAPLCTVATAVDPNTGASDPGSAAVIYTSLGGLLGGLASGTGTWTSPSFTWAGAAPEHATLSFARRATIGGLLNVGGSATARIQMRDLTTGELTTIASGAISTAEGSFVTQTLAVDTELLQKAHSYRLLITTNLSAAALLSGIRVSYDDIALTATVGAQAGTGGDGDGDTTGARGSGSHATTPPAGTAKTALHLLAPRVVHFEPGRAVTLRIRAVRAGAAVRRLAVTLRAGALVRRLVTGRDGYASIRLLRRDRSALRITFRAGAATTATWLRPAGAA